MKRRKIFHKDHFFEKNDSLPKIIYMYAALCVMAVVAVYPILSIFTTSIRPGDRILSTSLDIIPSGATFDNYITAFQEKPIMRWVLNTVIVAGVSTSVTMAFSVCAGYAFSRYKFYGKKIGMLLLLTTQMFPAPMVLLPLTILLGNLGLIGNLIGLVIPYIATAVPFTTWLMKGFFDTIPYSLEESAFIDGAGVVRTFWKIVLPLSKPAVAVSAIFSFIGNWSEYIVARIIILKESDYTLPLGLMLYRGERYSQWGEYSAVALLTTIPVVIIFIALSRHIAGNLTIGGVKE